MLQEHASRAEVCIRINMFLMKNHLQSFLVVEKKWHKTEQISVDSGLHCNTHDTVCLYMCDSVCLKPCTELCVPASEQEMNTICPRCHIRNTRCSLSELDVSLRLHLFFSAFTWTLRGKLNSHIHALNHTFYSGVFSPHPLQHSWFFLTFKYKNPLYLRPT